HEWDGYSSNITFVGLQNYAELLRTDRFWNSVVVNWIVVIGTIIAQMSVALLLALVLSRKVRGMKIFRTAAFTPQVLSIAAVGMIWTLIYDPYQGLLNGVLQALGFENFRIAWLGNTNTALLAMLWTTTWFYFGFHTLLFMAGLAAIPDEYYDAARLETNRWYHTLRYITLPLLREQLLISFVLMFSGAFGHIMGLFFLMTRGGPAGRTELMGLYMERLGFRAGQVGMASAISILMLITVFLVVIWPAILISRERLEYS
ncbi:MAG: sugar ABC transporter permease, partial [Anaerolineales bacterium]|nr:sugar ABC transporter permease [Anaerolineales bacterium]